MEEAEVVVETTATVSEVLVETPDAQLNSVQQQNTLLQENIASLKQQLNISQEQLSVAQTESASYKKRFDEMTEKYNKLANTSGIDKLRDLFQQLTPTQTDALHTHTNFRVDTFETVHCEQQIQCSTQFVQSILKQLQSNVDSVIQLQKNILADMKKAKESVNQTLTSARGSKETIDASIKPIEIEIEQIKTSIEGWDRFSAASVNVINQTNVIEVAYPDTVIEKVSECVQ